MTKNIIRSLAIGVTASAAVQAGEMMMPAPVPPPAPAGDWCDTLQNIGKLYKDKNNPFLQEFKVFGRFQYQYSYTDGELNGVDFDGDGGEIRRFRLGAQAKFLDGFTLKGNINVEEGGFRDNELGYSSFDELKLTYKFGDKIGIEDAFISVGRHKFVHTWEVHESSKKIKTIERSNISNFFFNSARPTAVKVGGNFGGFDVTLGYLDTDDNEVVNLSFDGDKAYHISVEGEVGSGDLLLDYTYVDADDNRGDFKFDWGFSAAYNLNLENGEILFNAIVGADTNGDEVYGFIFMPSTFFIEDRLEGVFRYQYAGSEGNAIRPNSRSVRNVAGLNNLSVSRGDSNHTFYAGLNYYLCDHNAKFMTGVEYETLEGDNVDLEALTLWAAFRSYF